MNQEENKDKSNEDAYEFERSLISDRELFGLDDMTLYTQCPECSDNEPGNRVFYPKNFYYSRQNPLSNDVDDGYVSTCNESGAELNTNISEEISTLDKCVKDFETGGACNEINTEYAQQPQIGTTSLQYGDHSDDVISKEPCPETSRISLIQPRLIPINVEIYKRNYALRKKFEFLENKKNSDLYKQKPSVKRTYNELIQNYGNNLLPAIENEEKFNNDQYFLNGYKNKSNLNGVTMKRTLQRIDYQEMHENRIKKEKVSHNNPFVKYIN